MKKYMIMCMTVMAIMLSSCKNEDISITREINFEINPYTVVRDFTYDPLESITVLPSDGNLRVRLFIYDSEGQLVQLKEQELDAYDEIMNESLQLANGSYTAIAISDVSRRNNVIPQYWRLDGESQLSTLKLFDEGWISQYKTLGVAQLDLVVSADSPNSHLISIKPAGALIMSIVYDIHHFDDNSIDYYELLTNRDSEACSFDENGAPVYDIVNSNFESRLAALYTNDYNYGGLFVDFELPLGKTKLKWSAAGVIDITEVMEINMKENEEYLFELDLEDGTYSWGVVNGVKGGSSLKQGITTLNNSIKDYSSIEMRSPVRDNQGISIVKLIAR